MPIAATPSLRKEIITLLQSQHLPVEDLPVSLDDFLVVVENNCVVGVIGLERYGEYGLLRSMAVHPGYRNRRIAATLVEALEQRAVASGMKALYLLTETAPFYFDRKGYKVVAREEVPEGVKVSPEFSHVCPVSATVMVKHLI